MGAGRIVFTADIHLHPHRIGSATGGLDRLADGLAVLEQSLDLAVKLRATWINLGDFKVPRHSWPQEPLVRALALLRQDRYAELPKMLVPGNHDGASEAGTGLSPFADVPGTWVFERPTIISLDKRSVAVWPAGDMGTLPDLIAEARTTGARVLLGHAFLAGVFLGPDDTRLPGKGVPLESLALGEVFDLAVFGDIHKAQELVRFANRPPRWQPVSDAYAAAKLAEGQPILLRRPSLPWRGEVFYPGSPYQQSWGERADWPKGVLVVELDSGGAWFYPLPSPRFRLIDWRAVPAARVHADALTPNLWRGDIVRVLAGPWHADKAAVLDALRGRSGARTWEVIPPPPTPAEGRAPVHAGLAPRELLGEYVKARPLEGVAASTLLAAGLKLWGGGKV